MKNRTLNFLLSCSCGAMLLLSPTANAATTVTLRPDNTTPTNGDAFVTTGPSNNLTGNNYGGAGALGVTAPLSQGTFASLIRMDVSSAVATFNATYGVGLWTIDSITMELTTAAPNNAIFNSPNVAGLFGISWFGNDSWTEGTGTPAGATTTGVKWSDIASLTSGAQSLGTFSYDAAGTDIYTLALTSGLVNDVTAGGQVSFYLTAADTTVSALFNARNNGVAANRPALAITASATSVPEPSRAMLMLGSLAVAFTSRRRRA